MCKSIYLLIVWQNSPDDKVGECGPDSDGKVPYAQVAVLHV